MMGPGNDYTAQTETIDLREMERLRKTMTYHLCTVHK